MRKTIYASFVWLMLAVSGCSTTGELTTTNVGKNADKLADVAIRTDMQVTKAGADVPIAFTRVNQLAFFDPKTGDMLSVPDGRGGKLDVIRTWTFDFTDTMMMRTLPAVLNTLTGVVGQGTYGLKLAREQARLNAECVKAGTCLQGPSTVVNAVAGSSSNSQAVLEGVTLQTLINLGCAATGNCTPPPVPNGPPPPTPTPSGGN